MAHGKSRFKRMPMGKVTQSQQQAKINVPLNQLDDIICGNCGASLFIQPFAMKHLPAIYSPGGQEGTVNVVAGVMCIVCGAINNTKRKEKEKEETKLKQASEEFEKEFLNDTEGQEKK